MGRKRDHEVPAGRGRESALLREEGWRMGIWGCVGRLACVTALTAAPAVSAGAATYYAAPAGSDSAAGTMAAPWKTIQHGVDSLKPGDTLLLLTGTYRQQAEIKHGGTERQPVTIAAAPGARVVITGADLLTDWKRADSADPVFVHDWPYLFPIGTNPDGSPALTHPGDYEHELTGRAEQVIDHGRLLRQVLRRELVARDTFFVDIPNKKLYVELRTGGDPNQTEVAGSTRSVWLTAPSGVSYVHVHGIRFRYAANHAQRGAFAIGSAGNPPSRGWVLEDCVFERANGPGASFTGEGHVVRRCVFQDNGQLGFGTSRCHHTLMVDCGIYRNNTKGYSTGWEAGGLKVTMSRGFVFDHCHVADNRGCGIWYDIGNEQSEVKNCTIEDNDEAGIFYEISYGLHAHDNLIRNNANLGESPGGGWGTAGITLSSSEDCVIERNTLVGNRDGIDFREQERTTPRIDAPNHEVRVMDRNDVIRDNIVQDSTAYNIGFWFDTRFFGPHPSGADRDSPLSPDPRTLGIRLEGNRLSALPGRPNYLYGVPWRQKSRTFAMPSAFAATTGIPDSDRISERTGSSASGRDR